MDAYIWAHQCWPTSKKIIFICSVGTLDSVRRTYVERCPIDANDEWKSRHALIMMIDIHHIFIHTPFSFSVKKNVIRICFYISFFYRISSYKYCLIRMAINLVKLKNESFKTLECSGKAWLPFLRGVVSIQETKDEFDRGGVTQGGGRAK